MAKKFTAKIIDKQQQNNTTYYKVVDDMAGTVKAQATGTKIQIEGDFDSLPLAHYRVWSTIMKNILGPSWNKMSITTRETLNNALVGAGFNGSVRFLSLSTALSKVADVLGTQNITLDWIFDARGEVGNRLIDVTLANKDDSFSPIPIANSALFFSWYRFGDKGPYEIIAYLS